MTSKSFPKQNSDVFNNNLKNTLSEKLYEALDRSVNPTSNIQETESTKLLIKYGCARAMGLLTDK